MVVAASLFVAALGAIGEGRERELGNLHPGAQDNRDVIEIAKLQGDVEVVPGVYNTGAVVHDKANASEARLAVYLNQILV